VGGTRKLFDGNGEMYARCRAFDWAATPVGAVDAWPASLCTALGIVLASPQPMWIGWGHDLLQIFNDGYLPFSDRNPASLGRPARETWADIWHLIGPDLDGVRDGGPAVYDQDRPIPFRRRGDIEQTYFSFSYSPIPDAACAHGVGGVLSVAVETTPRVVAMQALRKSEERYRALATASADVIYRMSPDWSDMRQLDGRGILSDSPEPRTDWLERYIYPDDRARVTEVIREAVRTRQVLEREHRVIRADGTIGWTFSRAVPIFDERGEIVEWIGTASDVTQRREAEDASRESAERLRIAHVELEQRVHERTADLARANALLQVEVAERRAAEAQNKRLFERLISVQEEERRRIARDIHDQLGQQMTALRMNLAAARSWADGDPARVVQAQRTQQLAEDLDRSIDFLTWDLRPAALDHLGLAAALQQLVTGWSERFGVVAEFESPGVDGVRLPRDVEANLYRLAQEALHNIAKHAAATHVTVVLEMRTDRQVVLIVEDNGHGFTPGEVTANTRVAQLGLIGMRERALLLGGGLEIDSAPGRGTTIFVRVPAGTLTNLYDYGD
jgi:signal transduction histidine kinase